MKEHCDRDAKRAVQALTRRKKEDCIAMERGLLDVLNGTGGCNAAVGEGIHEALHGLFRDDAEQ
jgi:porphobilinogen deaminase